MGLKHSRPHDDRVLGETIKILANALIDESTGNALKDQTIFIYVSTSSSDLKEPQEKAVKEDISLSNAQL